MNNMNLHRKISNHYYGWSGIPNQWINDNDRPYSDRFFDDKNYEDFYFDNFYDMDKMFGHENSLYGTRGLPVGHPNRSSKSFDTYNKKFGPMIVRVIKTNDLQEQISRIHEMMGMSNMNILNKPLQMCGKNPMTGYFRDGYCKTDSSDEGTHTVCSEVDDEFLDFTKSKGNNLSFLKSGDKWCLCANRWKEAYDEGVAPKVIKNATNKKTLDVIGDVIFDENMINLKDEELSEYSRTLKNARKQGVGLRFPKSAIKANPARFRPYNR